MPRLTKAQVLFNAAQEAQRVFWAALFELEMEIGGSGVDIDSTRDLADVTLEDLQQEAEP